MVPAFGFSVGDFIAAGRLVLRVKQAFDDHKGASAEYQQLIQNIEALQIIFTYLQTLESDEATQGLANAIRTQAALSLQPLKALLESVEKYDKRLGVQSTRRGAGTKARQAQWALMVAEEVPKVLSVVSLEIQKMNMLLSVGQLWATKSSENKSRSANTMGLVDHCQGYKRQSQICRKPRCGRLKRSPTPTRGPVSLTWER